MKKHTGKLALIAALLLLADRVLTGCGTEAASVALAAPVPAVETVYPAGTLTGLSYSDSSIGGHAIHADGAEAFYANITVRKAGDAREDETHAPGTNAAVLAENGAALSIREASVATAGIHADAVFCCGEDSSALLADSTIVTSGDRSDGLVTADGGTISAGNLVVRTSGSSSAAIRADREGGAITVRGGTYSTDGDGSPAVFAAADVSISDAELSAGASQALTMEGANTVVLDNVTLTAAHAGKSSGSSSVLICQGASGASKGVARLRIQGGSLTSLRGDAFLICGSDALIELRNVQIVSDDPDGSLLRATAADRDCDGKKGADVTLHASGQALDGDVAVDGVSSLRVFLDDGSTLTGSVNAEDTGKVTVSLSGGSKWVLTGDSCITALTCASDSIVLNGFSLTVGGRPYTEGAAASAEA